MCGKIDFREYLLCALYLIKQSLPTIELVCIVSKMYDDCGKGPGRLTPTALHNILSHMIAASVEESNDIFSQIDCDSNGSITIGKLWDAFI